MSCPCEAEILRWIDAYRGHGPIRGWRQYQSSQAARIARSAEMHRIRVDDRAALIRRQIALVRESCNHIDQEAAS